MPKLMGIDVGSKTIGVAMSDETATIAFPRTTIIRQDGWRRDMRALRQILEVDKPAAIVVGLPLMMDGSHGVQADKIHIFVATLRNSVRIPIVLQDERLSTKEADRILAEAGRNRVERKEVVDSVAACLILQAYLDSAISGNELDTPADSAKD